MSNKMEEEKPKNQKDNKQQKGKKDPNKKEGDELSEEDKQLKDDIQMLCTRIVEPNDEIAIQSLDTLKKIVKDSTTSMTSVPKPFKFLKEHYKNLTAHYDRMTPSFLKRNLADFLSVLAMTMDEQGKQISLKYLQDGTKKDYKNWGHEYIHHLSAEIGQEYQKRQEVDQGFDDLIDMVSEIVPYFFENNAEHDAIDLLMEVDKLENMAQYVTDQNYLRVLQYLNVCSLYCADQDEMEKTLKTGYDVAIKLQQYTNALRLAIKLDQQSLIDQVFQQCLDRQIKRQLCFQISRQRIMVKEIEDDQELYKIASNQMLTEFYMKLAKELEVLDPKSPEQVYKQHLEEKNKAADSFDSAKENLANTYVNAFVNCGTKKDALMIKDPKEDKDPWIFKLKNEGQIAGVASIGMIDLWDIDQGNDHLQQYINLKDGYQKQGVYIGIGMSSTGVSTDVDTAKAILMEQIEGKEEFSKLGAIIGLGLAYAGSAREEFLEQLIPIVVNTDINYELSVYAALSLGLIFVGKCSEEVSNAIIETLSERNEGFLNQTITRFFAVALGLNFLGQQEKCEATLETLGMIQHPISKYVEVCIIGCAYVGSGNVLKVQKMLQFCQDKLDEKKSEFQQVAIMSIAMIASSEEIGNEMAMRSMNHILQYCDISAKRAVPLALAILNLSNPRINVMDLLHKLCHDEDTQMQQRAIMSLGLIGAGTNNSRLADILRNIASYYAKDSNGFFLVRLAQGLLHMGKGMLTIQPYYSDRFLLSKVGMAGIVTLMHSCLDMPNIILAKYHYMLFYLSLSIYPKMFFTLNENLENMSINVRVGQAVDVVGQAGKPKKITGFQTHNSPVLISYGERAELATDEYIPIQDSILENFVILKKNPDYVPEEEKSKKKFSVNL